jgi:hypothetical protein
MEHTHTIGAHNHSMNHTHSIALHTHNYNHLHWVYLRNISIPAISFEITAHSHSVSFGTHSHSVTLGTHTHAIEYGIHEGTTAASVTILVDGTALPAGAISGSEADVVAYLSTDADGKITRGAWHVIEIIPNTMTRIVASLFVQTFVQSVGGGDY